MVVHTLLQNFAFIPFSIGGIWILFSCVTLNHVMLREVLVLTKVLFTSVHQRQIYLVLRHVS